MTGVQTCALPIFVYVGARTGLGLPDSGTRTVNPSLGDSLGCQSIDTAFDPNRCIVSPTAAGSDPTLVGKTILLLGDSQAGAASDGVAAAANQLGMTFAIWYNNGCPVFPRPTDERADCPYFQSHLADVISLTQASVIVVANSSTLYTTRGPQRGGVTIRLESGKLAKNYDEAVGSWTEGLRNILGSDPFRTIPVILMQEVPPSDFTRVSLLRRTARDSVVSLKYFYDRNHVVEEEKLALEDLQNVDILDPTDVICPGGQCRTVLGGDSIYTDQYHLSPYGSRLLANEFESHIVLLLGGS